MDRVKNKIAIVTGGASGLGKSSAILLAREGAKIVITDLDEENGNVVVQQ
ncbi:SDR family NAD(P)-dependent oxidoreductase, partial [Leeuwenhoekiella sp.]